MQEKILTFVPRANTSKPPLKYNPLIINIYYFFILAERSKVSKTTNMEMLDLYRFDF
jgi:hypothetical protein